MTQRAAESSFETWDPFGTPDDSDNSVSSERPGATTVTTVTSEVEIQDGKAGYSVLDDNVQLHILKFCDLRSLRNMMQVNHGYRHLIACSKSLWIDVCCQRWHWLKNIINSHGNQNDSFDFLDYLNFPTSFVDDNNNSCLLPNLSFLLSQSAPCTSSCVDELSIIGTTATEEDIPLPLAAVSGDKELHKISLPSGETIAVQFVGTVGSGNRCIRADQPIPRPTAVLLGDFPAHAAFCFDSESPWFSMTPLLEKLHGFPCKGHQCMGEHSHEMVFPGYCGGHFFTRLYLHDLDWKPFVAPYMCRVVGDNRLKLNVTPRLVAYFEVSVLDPTLLVLQEKSLNTSTSGCVAIGIANNKFLLRDRMPGWDSNSYGYHGDDGGIYHGDTGRMIRPYGPRFGPGDTVGCGIDYASRAIFFTKNGKSLRSAFTDLSMLDPLTVFRDTERKTGLLPRFIKQFTVDTTTEWYPVVGLDSNDPVICNFGQTPFVFDLDTYQNSRQCRPYHVDSQMSEE